METQVGVATIAPGVRHRHGFSWGLLAGLVPNAAIFIAIFATPRVDEHVNGWLTLGVLYAGPVIVGLAGLVQTFSAHTRRCGVGLILAAPITVASWFLFAYVDTLIAVSANTAGG